MTTPLDWLSALCSKWFKRKKPAISVVEKPIIKQIFRGGPFDKFETQGAMVSKVIFPKLDITESLSPIAWYQEDSVISRFTQITYRAVEVIYEPEIQEELE